MASTPEISSTAPVNNSLEPRAPEEKKDQTVESLLDRPDFKFQIVFEGTTQTRATSISSDDLKSTTSAKVSKITLDTIRKRSKLASSYLFSINGTNTVEDGTLLAHYISLTKDNVAALREAVKVEPADTAIITVKYTSKHRPPAEIPKPPTLSTPPADDGKLPVIADKDKTPVAVNIATTGLVAGSGQIASTHPAELTGKQWNDVMVTNALLHGMLLDMTSFTFENARYPAFKLKPPKTVASDPSTKVVTPPKPEDGIPDFVVNDDSSVTITEVKSTYELSMAQHSFSSSSVAASASGGIGPVSGGVSASASWSSSHSEASTHAGTLDILHASYNFPRVKVFLDSDDLEVTDECQKLLNTIKTDKKREDVAKFYRRYGHIFASSIQLGGRLQTTKESTSSNETKYKEQKDALKVAAAASISTPYASGSVSASHGSGEDANTTKGSGKGSESLAWEAQGGETLLVSNPTAWITSVGSFYNWRVMGRSGVYDILTLLKRVSNKPDENWPTIFSNIEGMQPRASDPLVCTGSSDKPNEIHIKNNTPSRFRVAISRISASTQFMELAPGEGGWWPRSGAETAFINDIESDRIAMAMVNPGNYQIVKLPVGTASEYKEGRSTKIGVANTTTTPIQVRVTTLDPTKLPVFYTVPPGTTEYWSQLEYQTIFVKHSSSNILLTHFGIPGRVLQIGEPGLFSLPHFRCGARKPSEIGVLNAQPNEIHFKVSASPGDKGPEYYSPLASGGEGLRDAVREVAEVIYVNGPHGTAVGAYYGEAGKTLIVSHSISHDGK